MESCVLLNCRNGKETKVIMEAHGSSSACRVSSLVLLLP